MKKVVLKLDVHDGKCKQKAMKMASAIPGLESISMDMKEQKLTLTGDIDPVAIVGKLRKVYHTEVISVGPAKEPEKKDDPKKKEEPKKKDEPKKIEESKKKEDEPKKQAQPKAHVVQVITEFPNKPYQAYPAQYPRQYYVASVEEDPNACVIC